MLLPPRYLRRGTIVRGDAPFLFKRTRAYSTFQGNEAKFPVETYGNRVGWGSSRKKRAYVFVYNANILYCCTFIRQRKTRNNVEKRCKHFFPGSLPQDLSGRIMGRGELDLIP